MIAVLSCRLLLASFLLYLMQYPRSIPIWHKGVRVVRTIQSELKRMGLSSKEVKPPEKQLKKMKQYSRSEIEDLMGIRRQTYKQVNGAYRAK